jgi:cytoskeletal protein CcmA (bactofilin family)
LRKDWRCAITPLIATWFTNPEFPRGYDQRAFHQQADRHMKDPYDSVKDRTSILGPTIQFKGELSADEDLIVRGRIEGSITHTQRLTIGREGKVIASVEAQMVIVEGTIEGDVHADKSVAVREHAQLTGNICAPSVVIQEGAKFTGHIDMSGSAARASAGSDAGTARASTGAS